MLPTTIAVHAASPRLLPAVASASASCEDRAGSFATIVVPASPAMIPLRSASAPIAALFPVADANRHAACTFGPIEPAANSYAANDGR